MIQTNPKVTIVLATYNGAKYLKAAIDSCLKQTYKNIELVIVDDCSNDATADIVRSYSDPRIVKIRNEPNQRLPKALNIGFRNATGDYLTWTSDDNEFLPNAIQEMVDFLDKHKEVDFVYTDLIVRYFENGKEEVRKFSDINLEKENNIGACYLYTRRVYETIGDYDPRYEWVEDYDYWIRIAKKFQIRHLSKPLYIYGDHVQSLTSTRRYPIVMMRDVLRYRHGYLSLGEFLETVRQFSLDVRQNIPKRDQQLLAWKQVFQKVFKISITFGIFYSLLFAYLLIRKTFNLLLKPLVTLIRKVFGALAFHRDCSSLQKSPARINVLCLIPNLVVGGSEKVLWDIVTGLVPYGYDFHLLCNKKETNTWCRKFAASFKNVVLLNEFAEDKEYQEYLPEMIRRLDVQLLVNTNSTVGYRCLPQLKTAFKNLKTLDVLHLERVGGAIEKYAWVANYLDERVCISHHLREYMKKLYQQADISDLLAKRLDVVHNGIGNFNEEAITSSAKGFRIKHDISPETKIISFIGRFAPEKKPFLFIDIDRAILAKSSDDHWTFVMAGNGPSWAQAKNRIKEFNLERHFVLPGMLPQVSELLADTFLLLLVSEHEGIPLVIQDALAMDVPVVSTNVGAIRELVQDGVNGYLVSLNEKVIDEFADRVLQLANDQQLYETMSSRAKSTVYPEFSMDHMINRYHEIFDRMLQKIDLSKAI